MEFDLTRNIQKRSLTGLSKYFSMKYTLFIRVIKFLRYLKIAHVYSNPILELDTAVYGKKCTKGWCSAYGAGCCPGYYCKRSCSAGGCSDHGSCILQA